MMVIQLKNLLLSIGLLAICSLTACHGDPEENTIHIEVLSPTNNVTVPNSTMVDIHIKMSAKDQIHLATVKLTSKDNPEGILIDYSKYVHGTNFEYLSSIDLSFLPPGTAFMLLIEGCKDHGCTTSEKRIIVFKI